MDEQKQQTGTEPAVQVLEAGESEDGDKDLFSPEDIDTAEPLSFEDLPLSYEELAPEAEITPAGSTEIVSYHPLQHYLSEIRHLPRLSREEEHALAIRYRRSGDTTAAYKLVLANLHLVALIAREYQRSVQNVMDLIQEGNIGLLEAVKKFDPFRGVRFSSYAMYWVRAYMLRYLINNVRLVKIGTTQAQRKLFFNLVKEKDRLEREGFIPEAKNLAERLDVKMSEVLEMEQRLALPDLSVDAPLSRDDDSTDMHGIIPDRSENAEDALARQEFAEKLRAAVDEFKSRADEKERAIIEQRLFTEEPVTLQIIADQFSLTRERVRQIESRLKSKLKTYLAQRLELGEEGEVAIEKQAAHGLHDG